MALNEAFVRGLKFPTSDTVVADKDAMLYALSIGLGRDPLNAHDLAYVYEGEGFKVFPTLPLVIGHVGIDWQIDERSGVTRSKVVHGSQRLEVLAPLPVGEPIITANSIEDVFDKGDKGAIIVLVRETSHKATGKLLSRAHSEVFCRVDGGFGGKREGGHEFAAVPERAPDAVLEVPTDPNMALIYRLNQDRNPLHCDPDYAARAGFPRPILHGLGTYGAVAAAVARTCPDRTLRRIEARFSRPVFPGETLAADLWGAPEDLQFRVRVPARDVVVLDRGRMSFA